MARWNTPKELCCKNCNHQLLLSDGKPRLFTERRNYKDYFHPSSKFGYKHSNWSVTCQCGCNKPEINN